MLLRCICFYLCFMPFFSLHVTECALNEITQTGESVDVSTRRSSHTRECSHKCPQNHHISSCLSIIFFFLYFCLSNVRAWYQGEKRKTKVSQVCFPPEPFEVVYMFPLLWTATFSWVYHSFSWNMPVDRVFIRSLLC